MTHHTELTVRRSRIEPDKYVICVRSTRTALAHPELRLCDSLYAQRARRAGSYFDDPTQALLAIDDWKDVAAELPRKRYPLPPTSAPKVRTLADELKALRAEQAKRDRDPLYKWHPCTGAHCDCKPAPDAFRTPSKELLAMQAGKPAYGQPSHTR